MSGQSLELESESPLAGSSGVRVRAAGDARCALAFEYRVPPRGHLIKQMMYKRFFAGARAFDAQSTRVCALRAWTSAAMMAAVSSEA